VRSDPTLLNRVLMNLVANALRYTEHGRILVGCKRSGPAEVRIVICDTGCGIPSDQLEAIFGEFVQLDNSGRGRSEGLGLGLAIVARMAQLLGHQVTVRSRVGRGSIFAVRLPLAGFQKSAVHAPVMPGTSTDRVAGSFVVVVDHEQDILFSMDALLTKHGCHVVCARNGDEALMRLTEHLRTPDLILTDYLVAPGETGLDVIAKICATQNAQIPALVVTGASSEHDLAEVTGKGYPVMFKPLTETQLLAKIAEMLPPLDDQSAVRPAADDTLPAPAGQVARSSSAAPHAVLERG
jgi:CheY-like chemotaxis protein